MRNYKWKNLLGSAWQPEGLERVEGGADLILMFRTHSVPQKEDKRRLGKVRQSKERMTTYVFLGTLSTRSRRLATTRRN